MSKWVGRGKYHNPDAKSCRGAVPRNLRQRMEPALQGWGPTWHQGSCSSPCFWTSLSLDTHKCSTSAPPVTSNHTLFKAMLNWSQGHQLHLCLGSNILEQWQRPDLAWGSTNTFFSPFLSLLKERWWEETCFYKLEHADVMTLLAWNYDRIIRSLFLHARMTRFFQEPFLSQWSIGTISSY